MIDEKFCEYYGIKKLSSGEKWSKMRILKMDMVTSLKFISFATNDLLKVAREMNEEEEDENIVKLVGEMNEAITNAYNAISNAMSISRKVK